MRPISIRCSWGWHNADDEDKNGWPACSRCGQRAKIKHDVIQAPELAGRVMNRPKHKAGRMLPVEKQKPFVRAERRP